MLRLAIKAPLLAFFATSTSFGIRSQSYGEVLSSDNPGEGNPRSAWRQSWQGRRGARIPTWLLPRFEIHDVRDDPSKGRMTRIAVDKKQLLFLQYPQLGPRKMDPNDDTPQFDFDRRISVRLRHMDLAGLVSVVEGRVESHAMKNNAYDLVFEKTSEGGYVLSGTIQRATSDKPEPWSVHFDSHFGVTIEHFLQNALTESFGFMRFQERALSRNDEGRSTGGRRWNYGPNRRRGNGDDDNRSSLQRQQTIE
ncbi:unnamed protein product [Phytomonas sp. EM1]|nr:unnamed protein product [Phytomonas sp. EM1]|eukprot:CCW64003.1 unnamed protein product [Phytomonas sp. isolate EM1]